MELQWKDLQGRINCFTVRNAVMIDFRAKKPVRCYSANTRITIVQKCVTPDGTLYRTQYAKDHSLDWAFKASAFGLPDEKAPSVPSISPMVKSKSGTSSLIKPGAKKQKSVQHKASSKDGGKKLKNILHKLFRRKNG